MIVGFLISANYGNRHGIADELGKLSPGDCALARGSTRDEIAIGIAANERPQLHCDVMHCAPDATLDRDARYVATADRFVVFRAPGDHDLESVLALAKVAKKSCTIFEG